MTRGYVTVHDARAEHLELPLDKLDQSRRDRRAAARRLPGARWTGARGRSTW